MIDVTVDQEFLDQVSFIDEKRVEVVIEVSYEWKAMKCGMWKKIGHQTKQCNKGGQKLVWKPKSQEVQSVMLQKAVVYFEKSNEFKEATQKLRRNEKSNEHICVQTSFNAIDGMMEEPVFLVQLIL